MADTQARWRCQLACIIRKSTQCLPLRAASGLWQRFGSLPCWCRSAPHSRSLAASHLAQRSPQNESSRACPVRPAPASLLLQPASRARGRTDDRRHGPLRGASQTGHLPVGIESGTGRPDPLAFLARVRALTLPIPLAVSQCFSAVHRPAIAAAEIAASLESRATAAAARIKASSADRTALPTMPLDACAAVSIFCRDSNPRCCAGR